MQSRHACLWRPCPEYVFGGPAQSMLLALKSHILCPSHVDQNLFIGLDRLSNSGHNNWEAVVTVVSEASSVVRVGTVGIWVGGIVVGGMGVGSIGLWVGMVVNWRVDMIVDSWNHRHGNRFSNHVDRCKCLLGSETSSSSTLEFSIKGSLGISNFYNIIKVCISNLCSLDIVIDGSKSNMLASFGNIKCCLERGLGSSNLWGVLHRCGGGNSQETGKDQLVHSEMLGFK